MHGESAECTGDSEDGVAVARVTTRPLETRRIVREAKRIHRLELFLDFLDAAVIEQNVDVLHGAQPAMQLALRTDVEILEEVLANIRMTAGLAFLPDIGRDLEFIAKRAALFLFFAEPSHA